MKKCILALAFPFMSLFAVHGQIASLGNNNWEPIGNANIVTINSDGDNGDGVSDGAQMVRNLSSGVGHGMRYTFDGSMKEGEQLNFETYVFNPQASYVKIQIDLYNKTDDIVLTSSEGVVMTSGVVKHIILNYTPLAADEGDQLQVRYIRVDDGNTARSFAIDNAQLNEAYLFPEAPPAASCFDDTGAEAGWDRIGDVSLTKVTNDGDNGDGQNDGALALVSLSSGAGVDQGSFYAFDCLMSTNQTLQIETVVYNNRNSYVRVDVQLYNSTDDVVIASTGATPVLANATKTMGLTYLTEGTDDGDQLQLRYLRADDGNPVRSFNIDWATINGTSLNMNVIAPPLNPLCALGIDVQPDIALEAVTAQEVAQAEKVYNTLSDTYLGTEVTDDFQDQMDQALLDYDGLNITKEGVNINGEDTSFRNAGSIVSAFAKYLKFVNPNDTLVAQKAAKVVELVSQQFCKGIILLDGNAYDFRRFARPVMYLKDYLSDSVKDQFGYVLDAQTRNFQNFWGDYQEGQEYNTDWMYNMGELMVLYGIWRYPNNDEEKVRYLKGGKRYIERFLTYSDGTGDGVKPDGTGFHHWTAYDNYMYSFSTTINIIAAFDDTNYQIDKPYYFVMRDAIFAQKMIANDAGMRAFSMSGRSPGTRYVSTGQNEVRKLAISGGKILGLSTADPILAGYHNRVWGNESDFNYTTVAPYEEGFLQLNHGHAGVFRKDNWTAVFKGFSNNMWGAELYSNANRYGRYQSYGAAEILYPGGIEMDGNGFDVETWDWNHNPGTTVIKLPWEKLQGERSRIDELQQKRFVGALAFDNKGEDLGALKKTYGTYGVFAMDFQEMENQGFGISYGPNTHNGSFTFKKSYFTFDDIIVCLGSGISNNDADNPTVTTLYQRTANNQSGVTVNSAFYGTGEHSFFDAQDNWVVDDFNTGFYVVSGSGDLKIRKGNQQTPNQNEIDSNGYLDNAIGMYTLGYIDHGTEPVDAAYEYVIKPNAIASDMEAMAARKPYTVLEKSVNRHVVKHNTDNIWGYSLFEPSTDLDYEDGLIKANDAPCLVMYKKQYNRRILLSMTDPDLGFKSRANDPALVKNVLLTLHGQWSLSQPHKQVTKVAITDSTTTLQFTVEDALAVEVSLVKRKAVKKIHLIPSVVRNLKVDDTYRLKGFVIPHNATDVNLVWNSEDETVATIDQKGLITGVTPGNTLITLSDTGTGKFDTVEVIVSPRNGGASGGTLIVYPNPTRFILFAKTQKHIAKYEIYDHAGKVRLSRSNLRGKRIIIPVYSLKRGIYILKVTDKKGHTISQQFIKE